MFVQGAVIAWAPSYLNRYYSLDPAQAGVRAGVLVLIAGVGMTVGGVLVDRLSGSRRSNRLRIPALYALTSGATLLAAFLMPPGTLQFSMIALGLFLGAGFAGPSGAVVADVTNPAIRATVFATLTLANNLIEGINNKIKVIKRMAYGFRDDAYFFLKIRAAFPGIR